jgi:IS5 family transposase
MQIYNELKLRFEQTIWALYPELALFDTILDKKPEFIKLVENDVLKGLKNNDLGRKDSPTVEQVLRAAVYKEIKQLDYRELALAMYDSKSFNLFMKLDSRKGFSYSVLQKYISKIKEENIRKIIIEINKIAVSEGIEDLEKVSSDTTTVETNIHYPTNNSLIWDCIKVATRLLKKIKKDNKDEQDKLDKRHKEAKKLNYQINNTKKDGQKTLFDMYLVQLQVLISEVKQVIESGEAQGKIFKELKSLLPKMEIIYTNSKLYQLDDVKVKCADKLFSIHETHTNILVKGLRDIDYGHKVLITRGNSNLILDYGIYEGNPNDKNLLIPSLDKVIKNYTVIPNSASYDGGFASQSNLDSCKERGIVNTVFTKVTKSLKNIAVSVEVERMLKKWRGTTEAVISNLKRGFGLSRVLWIGWEKFQAKVAWSILCYNLRVICNKLAV